MLTSTERRSCSTPADRAIIRGVKEKLCCLLFDYDTVMVILTERRCFFITSAERENVRVVMDKLGFIVLVHASELRFTVGSSGEDQTNEHLLKILTQRGSCRTSAEPEIIRGVK